MDMYFGEDSHSGAGNEKMVKAYKNGDLSHYANLRIKANMKIKEFSKEIEEKLHIVPNKEFRFFNQEGLELGIDDLQYLKNGATIFISRGLSEYEVIQKLGEGGFGEVDLAVHKETGEKVAIKFLKAALVGNASEIDTVFAEGEMLKSLNHKGIVKVLNCLQLGNMKVAFIMEYLEGGELKDYIIARERLSEDEAREFFSQIADAVYYCHREKLIHRDLKLENILLQKKDNKIVKIVDFGIAGLSTNLGGDIEAGSLDYMAPETLNGKVKGVHPGVDVWALGVILFGMVAGTLPFTEENNDRTIERIFEADYRFPPKVEKNLSREIKDLISKMLTVDHKERITMVDLVNHPWLTGGKLEVIEEKKEEPPKANGKVGAQTARVISTKKFDDKKDTGTPTSATSVGSVGKKPAPTTKSNSGTSSTFSYTKKDEKASPLKPAASGAKTPTTKPTGGISPGLKSNNSTIPLIPLEPEETKKK